jgi:DNA polymerase I-like protein with 3'-5' exonuclease and polymerase domains
MDGITKLSVDDSLSMISSWPVVQYDSETNGLDCHVNKMTAMQFGYYDYSTGDADQIVVDVGTIDPRLYKEVLENSYLIGHNIKFDIEFLYNYSIIPLNVYDTMVCEQVLYMGYNAKRVGFSLKHLYNRYTGEELDKSFQKRIASHGLTERGIRYSAQDVVHLQEIRQKQIMIAESRNCTRAFVLENRFVPAIAYLEWCGIKLDEAKWIEKMKQDKLNLDNAVKSLNDYCIQKPQLKKWVFIDTQGDLFNGFNLEPQFNIDWQKKEAIKVFQALGFDTKAISKTTGKETDSITEKLLAPQKGIDDEFLKKYLDYQGFYKVTTSFGQGHLNAINPITGRIHTVYRAIGTVSGRMSSGSDQPNDDLAKLKKIPAKECTYPNMQQLPHDAITRGCFVSEPGNLFCSCDYSAMEARIGADVYNEHKLLDEFLYGSGDTHAAYAKAVFAEELKDIETKDIKAKRPDLRSKVKSVEFAVQFGSDGTAVAPQLKISVEEARQLVINLLNGMTGLRAFKEKWSKFVLENGYMPIMPQTGHRAYWHDWEHWKDVQASYTREFWDNYKLYHKGTGDDVCKEVKQHFQAKSKWCDRMSLNLPTQGGGAICLKEAAIALYKWVVDNGYWGKILFVNFTHDEINTEFPEELKDIYPQVVARIMKEACAKYYHKLPIPAVPEVSNCWVH